MKNKKPFRKTCGVKFKIRSQGKAKTPTHILNGNAICGSSLAALEEKLKAISK